MCTFQPGLVLATLWGMPSPLPIFRPDRRGVTLIEAVLASAVVGASFVAFFGLAGQTMASAQDARNITMCGVLAEYQMNTLVGRAWQRGTSNEPMVAVNDPFADLTAGALPDGKDPGDDGTSDSPFVALEHPNHPDGEGGWMEIADMVANRKPVDAGYHLATDTRGFGSHEYYVSWDVLDDPYSDNGGLFPTGGDYNLAVKRLRVRCVFENSRGSWRGLTLQSLRRADGRI